MRRLGAKCFPFRSNGVTKSGTKAPVKTLEARDRRSPLTTWRMSRIAKGSYSRARCCQKQALAQIAKSGGLRFRSELLAVLASGRGGCQCWHFLTRESFVMHIDIDPKHSRAIVQEVGERLRAVPKQEPECPGALERKSTGSANWKSSHHQSFLRLRVGTSVAVEPLWTAQTVGPNMDEQCHR